MWMTRKRFRRELRLALESERWPRPPVYAFSGDDPYVPPVDLRPSPKTEAHIDKVVREALTAALKPYAHLICQHNFKSADSACERWTCAKCGMRNPKWEWKRVTISMLGPSDDTEGWTRADWVAAEPFASWRDAWYYRDWPKAKRGKR